MILVIDNYDSFVHNLARYFRQLGCETIVVRNDEIDVNKIDQLAPEAIVISPGPCTPGTAGCCIDVIKQFGPHIPMLGICLGHQAIVEALGGKVKLANEPIHGRQSEIIHTGSKMFTDVRKSFLAGRYHSLIADRSSLPTNLNVTAKTIDGAIMAIEHKFWPVVGLQFHPESILTDCGYQLLINFLKIANIEIPKPDFLSHQPQGNWGNTGGMHPNGYPISDRLTTRDAP